MSLSDIERLRGMYYNIRNLTELAKTWKKDYRLRTSYNDAYTEVRDLIDELWHAFLGSDTQIISDTQATIKGDSRDPWGIAIVCQLENTVKEKNEKLFEKPFDAIEYINIPMLVNHERWLGVAASYVLEVYQYIEQLMYFLHRYNDDFCKQYENVSILLSKIRGECFTVFSRNSAFPKAYLIHQMLKILYGPGYPYDDPDVVTEILMSHYHDFTSLMKLNLKDLTKHHIELAAAFEKARKRTQNKVNEDAELTRLRLFKTIEFAKQWHGYSHICDDIVRKLEGTALAQFIPAIQKEWEKYKERKAEESKKYYETSDNLLDCYGFENYHNEGD